MNAFLTKAGNYSREETNKGEETIQGNTVIAILFKILSAYCGGLLAGWDFHGNLVPYSLE